MISKFQESKGTVDEDANERKIIALIRFLSKSAPVAISEFLNVFSNLLINCAKV
jgi:hypothetical protein